MLRRTKMVESGSGGMQASATAEQLSSLPALVASRLDAVLALLVGVRPQRVDEAVDDEAALVAVALALRLFLRLEHFVVQLALDRQDLPDEVHRAHQRHGERHSNNDRSNARVAHLNAKPQNVVF